MINPSLNNNIRNKKISLINAALCGCFSAVLSCSFPSRVLVPPTLYEVRKQQQATVDLRVYSG